MSLSSLAFTDAGFAYPDTSGEGLGTPVVSGLTLQVRPGEVMLLCGRSGCGKSTALKMANGLIPHYVKGGLYGEVTLDGVPLGQMPLHEVSRRVGSVFQNPRTQLFNSEVRAELASACENAGAEPAEIRRRIECVAREFSCEALLGRTIFELSGGERQKVACMCVSVLDPDVVVLDEPSSNLDTHAIDELRTFIASWKSTGKAVLVAEHRLYYLRDLVDQVIYLEGGRPTRAWSGAELRALGAHATDELGLRAIWPEECMPRGVEPSAKADAAAPIASSAGARRSAGAPQASKDATAKIQAGGTGAGQGAKRVSEAGAVGTGKASATARIRSLTCEYGPRRARRRVLDVPELDLPVGVPIALIGRNGAGKSTFLRTLAGLTRRAGGTCELPGSAPLDAKERLARSYLVMQDVTCQLFCPSVREEACLGQPGHDTPEARRRVDEVLAALDLDTYADAHPLALSGGQQQRVSIAAALTCGRDIVLFDEPTSGLDFGHMHQVADLITDIAAGERLVLVISHDYEFVCACCQHAVYVEAGHIVASYGLGSAEGAERLRAFFWSAPAVERAEEAPRTHPHAIPN